MAVHITKNSSLRNLALSAFQNTSKYHIRLTKIWSPVNVTKPVSFNQNVFLTSFN